MVIGMSIITFIFFLLFFFGCQYIVEKNERVKKLMTMRTRTLIGAGLLAIMLSAVIGILLNIEIVVIPMVTILVSSMITSKFRKIFTELEKGQITWNED